jgi:hypothetical protein
MIHIREYNLRLWDSQDDSRTAERTNPLSSRLVDIVRSTISKLGVDPDTCDKLPQWLAPDSDLWRHLGPNQARGFEKINTATRAYPVYPHDRHPCSFKLDPQIVSILGHYAVTTTRDMFGILRDGGLEVDEANGLIEATIEELRDTRKCMVSKLCCIYATKKG